MAVCESVMLVDPDRFKGNWPRRSVRRPRLRSVPRWTASAITRRWSKGVTFWPR